MASGKLQCVLLGLLLGLASAAGDNSNGAAASMDALNLNSAHWGDMFKHSSWLGDWQEKFSKMGSCDPSDTHCTISKTGSTDSKSSSSSIFGGNDEDYHCQVSADGRSKSCSYSSSSGRKLLQSAGLFSCAPGDEHCTTSNTGSANSNAFSSSMFGGNDQEMNCQVSADGMSKSCSSSSSSGGGSANANASGQSSGFWSSVGTAATTWWVWVLFVLAAAVALFTLARRRNIYVMMHGGQNPDGSYVGLPRFNKGRDNKEAQLY